MRTGISIILTSSDRLRLEALTSNRNTAQKHVWRAAIVLLSADGVGTAEIMRRTGTSKTCVWRWQERFMREGVDGLLRDKTRPARIKPLGPDIAERVVTLTLADPLVEATHWTAAMMAKETGISASAVRRIWRAHGLQPHAIASSSSPTTPKSPRSSATWSGSTSIHRRMPLFSRLMRRARSRRSTAPSPACR